MATITRKEAQKLEKEWGDKPCNHPLWGKEVDICKTGDYVCLQCGLTISGDSYEKLFKNRHKS